MGWRYQRDEQVSDAQPTPRRVARSGGEGKKCRVLIANDHCLFREGVVEICRNEPDIDVVGQAGDGLEVVALAEQSVPDVVLLDVEMPGPGVKEVLRELFACRPSPEVVILTVHEDPRVVNDLVALGVRAYLSKDVTRQELLTAIRMIRREPEQVVLSISRDVMRRLQNPVEGLLTGRELEVLSLVSQGLQNSQIAMQLFISQGTVKRHLTNVYLKLEVTSRIGAVNKAVQMGLLDVVA